MLNRIMIPGVVTMPSVSLGGPYPKCPKCQKGELVPTMIYEGSISWSCTNCGHAI